MKKEVIIISLLAVILFSPLVLAQEQDQVYTGFNRFVDNAKLFFSFGDNKVYLALEIREKEVDSAIENNFNGDDEQADKNLENAWKKLQMIQEKVSMNTAEEIKESSDDIISIIDNEEDLSENFDVYSLEEEKTGLTAEWVIEKEGKEGQNLSWEVVGNATGEQTRVVEIEKRIDEIDTEISEWVVEHTYAEGTTAGGEAGVVVEGGLANVVKTEVAKGDNGLKPEVKTSVAKSGDDKNEVDNDVAPGPQGIVGTEEHESNDNGDGSGDCGEGVVCGGEGNVIEGGEGTEGVNEEPGPAVESNEGDSSEEESSSGGESGDSSATGEAIKNIESEDNPLIKFFKTIFGH